MKVNTNEKILRIKPDTAVAGSTGHSLSPYLTSHHFPALADNFSQHNRVIHKLFDFHCVISQVDKYHYVTLVNAEISRIHNKCVQLVFVIVKAVVKIFPTVGIVGIIVIIIVKSASLNCPISGYFQNFTRLDFYLFLFAIASVPLTSHS